MIFMIAVGFMMAGLLYPRKIMNYPIIFGIINSLHFSKGSALDTTVCAVNMGYGRIY